LSLFITFEGPDGSGKSTQATMLAAALRGSGHEVVSTREPGGTPIGEQIRAVVHDVANTAMLPTTEILLYSASRAQLVGELIRPALARGAVVISDRYATSTLAYQGYGRGLDLDVLRRITEFATGGLQPDLVVYLDLDIAIGLQRKLRDHDAGKGEWNRMDQQQLDFHHRIREGYLAMSRQDPERWHIVDATRPVAAVQADVLQRVTELLATAAQ
jgi:dTMP kinase